MATNNTRSIGSEQAGKIVKKEVFRGEYRSGLANGDTALIKIRNDVFQAMMNYPMVDLVNIVTAYGDETQIQPNSGKDKLAELATEVLIINMDRAELKELIDAQRVRENELRNDIHEIENKQKKNKKKKQKQREYIGIGNRKPGHDYNSMTQKEAQEKLNQASKMLKVPKAVKSGMPRLRKEILDLLKDFTNFQIMNYAYRMKLNIEEGIPIKDIKNAIADSVVMYALVITNKLKVAFGMSLGDTSVHEELLSYTSFYYLTGNINVTPGEWAVKRKEARDAKALMDEKLLMAKKRKRYDIGSLTGGSNSGKELRKNDAGVLANATTEELIKLAGEYGINIDKKSKPEDIKYQIYQKMAWQQRRISRLTRKGDKGWNQTTDSKLAVHSAITSLMPGTLGGGLSSEGTPTITLNSKGEVTDASILSAVPVYIIGQGGAGTRRAQKMNLDESFMQTSLKGYENISSKWEDLSDKEKQIYNYIESLSNSDITNFENSVIANAPYKISDAEIEMLRRSFEDPKKFLEYWVAVVFKYKKLQMFISDKTKIVRYLKPTRNSDRNISKFMKMFRSKNINKENQNANKISELKGSSKDNWEVIKDLDRNQLINKILEASRNEGYDQLKDISLNGLQILFAAAIKDTDLERVLRNTYILSKEEKERVDGFIALFKRRKKINLSTLNSAMKANEKASSEGAVTVTTHPISGALSTEVDERSDLSSGGSSDESSSKISPVYGVTAAGLNVKNPDKWNWHVRGRFAMPVYNVNNAPLDTINSTLRDIDKNISDFKAGMSTSIISAPFGVGAATHPALLVSGVMDKIENGMKSVADLTYKGLTDSLKTFAKSATGAKEISVKKTPRLVSGGTSKAPMQNQVITGDALSGNIFKGGAKPELVSSNGDMSVTPLNRAGTEQKQKVSRMTSTERAQALATSISSHIVKYNYRLLDEATDASNTGEAIKVYSVKPGITDTINIDGNETSLAKLINNIYAGVMALVSNGVTDTQLLTTIAAKTGSTQVISGGGNAENPNNGFISSFDNILGGE